MQNPLHNNDDNGAPQQEPAKDGRAAAPGTPPENRRASPGLLSADELLLVGRFKRLYERVTGKAFDIPRFAADDPYGRAVLQEAAASPDTALAALARQFYDDNGQPKRHRRNR